MTGSASCVRNGVTIELNNGDAVYQADVVQTGTASTLGLVLVDGTTFNLSANARMMLNDLTYDPTSTSNTSLYTLVQGGLSFVAGQVAKTGDMKVETAVSVIGIRGTAVILDINSADGKVSISVVDQQDGQVHSVEVFQCIPAGGGVCSSGARIGTVTSDGSSLSITPNAGFQFTAEQTAKTPDQITQEFSAFQQVLSTYDAGKALFPSLPQHTENVAPNSNPSPTSTASAAGSSTPPSDLTGNAQIISTSADSAEHPSADTAVAGTALSSVIVNATPLPTSQSTATTIIPATLTIVPTTVAITTPVGIGNIINQSDVSTGFIITGTATADNAPVNGQPITVAIVDTTDVVKDLFTTTVTNGSWSVNVTPAQARALADGVYSIQATMSGAGYTVTTGTQTITVDTQPPMVTIVTQSATTNEATQTIAGTVAMTEAEVGSEVTLFEIANGVTTKLGVATVGSDGTWSTSVTLSGSGSHSIVVQDTDAAGNTGTSNPLVFVLETGPTVTIAAIEGNNVINAAEAAAGVALSGMVSGVAANSSFLVTVTDNGVVTTYTATVDAAGSTWSATIPAAAATALANGTATVSAQITDANGNIASASQSVTVAETGPTVTIAAIEGNNVINAAEAAAGVALSGMVSGVAANSSFLVTVTDNGVVTTYTATVDAAGSTWSATIPAAAATALANGTATVSAQITDANGNTASASQSVTVAETGPTVTIAAIEGNNVINAAEAAAGVALSGMVSGVAANSSFLVTVTDNGVVTTYTATVDAAGSTWSATIPAAAATALANGTATVSAQITDANGNTASASQSVTVAETGPTVTIAAIEGNNVINAAEAAAGVALSGMVSGVAANSSFLVTVTDNGVVTTYTATVDAAGSTWSATIPAAAATALANGTATVSAQITDANGNTASASQSVTVAETGPTVTIAAIEGNNVINAAEAAAGVALSGMVSGVAANSSFLVTVTDNGVVTTYTATVDAAGSTWSATIPAAAATALANGTATVSAQVTDANGNTASASQSVTVAETGPTVTIAAIEGNNVINAAEAAAGVALSGMVSGVAANSSFLVTVTDNGVVTTYTATVDAAGSTWSATIPAAAATALANGTATVSAQITDANGNTASASQSVTVAETGPTVTIAAIEGNNVINAAEAAAGVALSGMVSGVAANSSFLVTVTDNGVVTTYTATVDAAGSTWSATIPAAAATALANGTATVSAQVTDANGNTASASQSVTVAETGPTVTIAAIEGNNVINAAEAAAGVALSGMVSGVAANSSFLVTVTDNGVVTTYTATVDAAGSTWSATIPAAAATALANGTATVSAQVTDANGNTASASQSVTVAETGPTVTIAAIEGNNVINAAEAAAGVALSGMVSGVAANSSFLVTVTDNGVVTTYTATVDAAGSTWSATIPAAAATALANGTATVSAQVTDANGNTASASQSVTVAETGPTVTIAAIEGNNVINAAEAAAGVALSGMVSGVAANSSFLVTVTDNGVVTTYTATVDAAGSTWSATIPAAAATALANGTATVSAQVTDANGNIASASQSVTVAETGPTVTIAAIEGNNVINAAEAAAGVALSGMVSGVAANSSFLVTVTDNGVVTTYTATVDAAGSTWSATIPAAAATALANGTATVSAQITDANGNTASASQSVTVAETGPTVTIAAIEGNNVINAAEAAAGVALSGMVSGVAANSSFLVTVTDNGVVTTYTATVDAAGSTWSATIPAAAATALANGTATVSAQITDANGNTASASQSVTVAETGPTVTIAAIEGNNVINAAEAAAGVALSGMVSGVAANSSFLVTVTDNGVVTTYTATVDAAGSTWSATIPAAAATALANGTATVSAQVTDANGNTASASQSVTVAETGPTVTIAAIEGNNVINAAEAAAGVALSGMVSGVAANSSFLVTVTDNGVVTTYTATVDAAGSTWSATIPAAAATALANGTATVSAQVTDANGNTASASQSVTVAETGPTVTIAAIEGNNVINAAEAAAGVALSGMVSGVAANSSFLVTVTDNGVVTTYTATVDAAGSTWSATIPAAAATALANGTATVSAQITDANGNTASASQSVTVAETGPTVTIAAIEGNNVINAAEAAAGVALSGMVSGVAANSSFLVTVTDNGVVTTYTATVDAAGSTWSATIPAAAATALANGTATVSAQITDANGNTASASQSVTVAETGPTVTIAAIEGNNVINAAEAAAGVALSGMVSGVAANSSFLVTVTDNGVVTTYTATVDAAGSTWSATIPAAAATALANGTATVSAQVTDANGNTASASQSVTVAETGPTVTIAAIEGNNVINAAEAAAGVALSGMVSGVAANSSFLVTVTDNGVVTTYTATVDAAGSTWSATIPAAAATALANGTATVSAQITDANGNTASASQSVTVAETGPTVTIAAIEGNNVINAAEAAAGVALSGMVSGVAANSSFLVTVTDNGVVTTYTATVDAAGSTWSATIPAAAATALANGTATVSAQITDANGNTASASQSVTVAETGPTVTISTLGGTTDQVTQMISGTVTSPDATPGTTVTLFDTLNGNTTQIGTAMAGSGGAWSTVVTLAGNGVNSIVAEDTDVAGNTGSSSPVALNVTVTPGGWGSPTGGVWGDAADWSSGSVPGPTSNVLFNSVGATSPYTVVISPATTVTVNSITLDDPNVTLVDLGTLTIAASLIETSGHLEIANGGLASLGGGSSLLIDFTGTGGSLILGSSPGFTGTVDGISTATGAVTISGSGNVTTTSGDAIDLQGTGGTPANPSTLSVTPSGTIKGAANGVMVVQNAVGDITVDSSGPVIGDAGDGILAEVSATGSGNIIVTATDPVSGSGVGMNGVLAENLDASNNDTVSVTATGGASGTEYGIEAETYGNGTVSVEAGGAITSSALYGIRAITYGASDVSILTDPGSTTNAAGTGINAINYDTVIAASANAIITVTANGTVNFGSTLSLNGSQPKGIAAGFYGANATANTSINGTVLVNNYANITQTSGTVGYGINAYNYGNGNVTVNDEAGTTISAAQDGIVASPESGGTGNAVVNVAANDTIIGGSGYGVDAANSDIGDISVTTSPGDLIISGSHGINAVEEATAIPQSANSIVTVVAYGTIQSGTFLSGSGSQPNGIAAGYFGSNGTVNNAINGTVLLENFANITAAAGRGLDAYSYGNGAVTLMDESGTSVSGAQYGIGAYSNGTSGPATATTHGATSISSPVLNFASTPSWIVAGMTVYDVTTGKSIGTVASTTSTTVTLTANAANAVASGNLLSFPTIAITNGATSTSSTTLDFASTPSWITAGMTVYDATTGESVGTVASTTATTVTLTGNASNAVGNGDTLSFGDLSVDVLSNATVTGGSLYGLYGIQANTNNASNVVVTTATGDVINSGGTGISSNSSAKSAPASSLISITAYGTINSGFDMQTGGVQPAGILAGYNGGTSAYNPAIAGNVAIDDFAGINAPAGYGIGAYNFGIGNISATMESTSVINAAYQAVSVFAQGGGNVTIVNNGTIDSATGTAIAVGTGSSLTAAGGGILSVRNTGSLRALGASFNAGGISAVVQINNASTHASTFTNSGAVVSALYSAGSPLNWAVSSYYGGNSANNGAVSVTNSGVISGNAFLNTAPSGTASFQNQTGGIWNILGQNWADGAFTITNSGTVNMAGPSQIEAGGALTIINDDIFNIAAIAVAFIGGSISGTGTFDIGAQASLEFGGTIASGQTVSFDDEDGQLILDNPSGFSATIAGAVAGDIIEANGAYTPPAGFGQFSGNLWLMLPSSSPTMLTGSLGPQSLNPATAQFVQLSSAIISSSTAIGLNIFTADSNPADTLFTEINQSSNIFVSGAFKGVSLTTAGANIAVFNAGSISSTGAVGLSTSSGSGSTTIHDFGNISGVTGISAVAGGTAYTSAATSTTSNTLNFTTTPGWIGSGLTVFDETTGKSIGTVQSTTSTTVTLTGNVSNPVGSGDTLSFGAPTASTSAATPITSNVLSFASTPTWIVPGTAVYDQTTGMVIGTVSSTTANAIALVADAANPVGSGDVLAFAGPISINVNQSTIISGTTAVTNAATTTSSGTLSFASTLSGVGSGMVVYDLTTGQRIGTVSSTSSTTATLTANAGSPVNSGDQLSFLSAGSQGIVALTSSASASVNAGSSVNIIAGSTGIDVQNQGKLVAPSSLTVDAGGNIFSGLVTSGEPSAILAAYVGGTSFPSSIPNPPLSGIFGDVTVDSSANIIAYTGVGILALTYGTGNVSVSNSGTITATGAGNTNGTVLSTGLYDPTTAQFGIAAGNYGEGHITVVSSGSIASGTDGISASNAAIGTTSTPVGSQATPVMVSVVATGSITSGANLQNGGNAPAGIAANIDPGNISGYNGFVYGDVLVIASGSSIDAQAGDGIRAVNHGQGDVTVEIGNNESITALNTPTGASGNLSPYGIQAVTYGPGDITESTSSGDVITSGSTGVNATNEATAITIAADATVAVNTAGTINSGAIETDSGSSPSGINAGFFNGGAVLPNVNGAVIVNNSAAITAADGRGIVAYNYGNGDVTVNDSGNVIVNGDSVTASSTSTTTTQVAEYGIEAGTQGEGRGNVAINVYSGAISATATPTGSAAAATSTLSTTLSFSSTPAGIIAGMTAYDVTTGQAVGFVSSTTGTTVTLAANAVTAVASGDMLSFAAAITGSAAAATSTSNATLSFSATPAGAVADMTVYDVTTGQEVGTVSSTTGTTVSLAANAASAVTGGDTLAFSTPITNQVYAVFAENNDDGNTSVITGSGTSIYSSGAGIDATNETSPVSIATLTATTNNATATTSNILHFVTTPTWITTANPVYDVTTGKMIGTVSSTSATTVTLTANAVNAVGIGDKLSFSEVATTNAATPTSSNMLNLGSTPSWVVPGMTVYDVTTGQTVGTVSATTGTTIALAADAANQVGSGDALSFPEIATASYPTSTSSQTLNFAVTPSWIAPGMTVYDDTTGTAIGTVSSNTSTSVTLAADASSPVAGGDVLSIVSSSIVVTSNSTITSGNVYTGAGTPPAGIIASNLGGDVIPAVTPVAGDDGDITVNNFGNITAAAGDGIRAVTFGIGNVTVNEDAGTIIALAGPSPTDGFGDGINARNWGPGNISVTTASGITIDSGSSGISAINYAPSTGSSFAVASSSQITVIAYGTIGSGAIPTLSGDEAAGILAGYNPGVSLTNPADAVNANVAGNVLIQDYASIIAAAGTDGIRGFNYGTGSVTVLAETGATITGGRYGISGFAYDGGDVSITNYATVTGSVAAVDAQTTGGDGTVTIDNYGILNGAIVSDATTAFENEVGATWNATSSSSFSGPSFKNAGTIDVTNGALTISASSYVDTGSLIANGGNILVTVAETGAGNATIYGSSQISYDGPSNGNVTFAAGATGELVLRDSVAFAGTITGFTGSGGGPATSDKIDLSDINISSAQFSKNYANNELTVTDGTHTANIVFIGNYTLANFSFETDGSSGTLVTDPPVGSGQTDATSPAIEASTTTTINSGATVVLNIPSTDKIAFTGGTGTLVFDQPTSFTGQIAGFTGTAPDAAHSDVIDVAGIDRDSAGFTESYKSSSGVLTLSDGIHSASLTFDNFNGTFNFSSDGHGGTLIMDPPAITPPSGAIAVTIADQFFLKEVSTRTSQDTLYDFGPGQARLGLNSMDFDRNDARNNSAWLALTPAERTLIDVDSNSQHPHEEGELLKTVVANLHANDFLLLSH
ncbi:hypothetical protein [Bradyrhizobium genosp. P]|uniref:hypothetical protein n=1 Tax=Bradyrhizobium genosp. P TaxID=83641 RepID=UPI003CF9A80F